MLYFKRIIIVVLTSTFLLPSLNGCTNYQSNDSNDTQSHVNENVYNLQNNENSNDNHSDIIFSVSGQNYYNNGKYIFNITDDNIKYNILNNNELKTNSPSFIAIDDSKLYGRTISNHDMFIYDFSNKENITCTDCLNEEKFSTEYYNSMYNSDGFHYYESINDLLVYNKRIYFNYNYMSSQDLPLENTYKIGSFDKNFQNMSIIDDIIAESYTIYEDKIYYINNGYEYIEDNNSFSFDNKKAGIYSYNIADNKKTLLAGNYEYGERSGKISTFSGKDIIIGTIGKKISVYNDRIFYIDNSNEGSGRLCMLNIDGTNKNYISSNPILSYTVYNDSVYYVTDDNTTKTLPAVFEINLNDNSEMLMFNCDKCNNSDLCVYNNYLYFSNVNYTNHIPIEKGQKLDFVCGARYNLVNKKFEFLYGYQEVEIEKNEDAFNTIKKNVISEKDPVYFWKEATISDDMVYKNNFIV